MGSAESMNRLVLASGFTDAAPLYPAASAAIMQTANAGPGLR